MVRLKLILIFTLSLFQLGVFGQDNIALNNYSLQRFHHSDYKSFREYISRNAHFLPDAFDNTGVLIAGIVLNNKGGITQVFSFNSLSPSIDNSILTLFESTAGHWKALSDSTQKKKSEIIIVPVVFCLKGTEYKIDTSNFKLPVQKEIILTALIAGEQAIATNYQKTESLLKNYGKLYAKENYSDAYHVMIELLKREPFNTQYYSQLMRLSLLQGDNESTCSNLKFVKKYLVNQPDSDLVQKIKCE